MSDWNGCSNLDFRVSHTAWTLVCSHMYTNIDCMLRYTAWTACCWRKNTTPTIILKCCLNCNIRHCKFADICLSTHRSEIWWSPIPFLEYCNDGCTNSGHLQSRDALNVLLCSSVFMSSVGATAACLTQSHWGRWAASHLTLQHCRWWGCVPPASWRDITCDC